MLRHDYVPVNVKSETALLTLTEITGGAGCPILNVALFATLGWGF